MPMPVSRSLIGRPVFESDTGHEQPRAPQLGRCTQESRQENKTGKDSIEE
jgi:hypothetical protein